MNKTIGIRFRHGVIIALATALGMALPGIADAQGTPIDSLVRMLSAPQWEIRSTALSEIRGMQDPLPAALRPVIVALVTREALAVHDHVGDEAYGEYVIDLAVAVVKVGDKRAIPALLALGGLEISSGVSDFIASGGPSIFPTLDSLERANPLNAGMVLETVSHMWVTHGSTLSRVDSAYVLSRMYGAATSPVFTARSMLADLAPRIPLPDLVPALRVLATTDTFRLQDDGTYPVRLDAQAALDALTPKWNALSATAMLAALGREVAGACAMASGALLGHCQSMNAHLGTVNQHMGDANTNAAQNGVKNFRKALQQAAGAGLLPLSVTLMDANASRLADLLGG